MLRHHSGKNPAPPGEGTVISVLTENPFMGGIAGAHAIPQHLQVFQRQCSRQGRPVSYTHLDVYKRQEPFITLWLGSGYILPREIMILIIINLFITVTRGAVDQFLYGYGLFWDCLLYTSRCV